MYSPIWGYTTYELAKKIKCNFFLVAHRNSKSLDQKKIFNRDHLFVGPAKSLILTIFHRGSTVCWSGDITKMKVFYRSGSGPKRGKFGNFYVFVDLLSVRFPTNEGENLEIFMFLSTSYRSGFRPRREKIWKFLCFCQPLIGPVPDQGGRKFGNFYVFADLLSVSTTKPEGCKLRFLRNLFYLKNMTFAKILKWK